VDPTWRGADDVFWKKAEPVTVGGAPTHILNPTHQLLHTCLHGGRYNEFHPMRWIGDAMYILRKDEGKIDWDELLELGRFHHMLLVLRSALRLLAKEFRAPIPVSVVEEENRIRPTYMETTRYRLITERVDGFSGLIRRDWYQHCLLTPEKTLLVHAITFPAYLKKLWRIESWWKLPGCVCTRALYRTGFISRPASARSK